MREDARRRVPETHAFEAADVSAWCEAVQAERADDEDRRRAIEAKLSATLAFATAGVSIVGLMTGFLQSERFVVYTSWSVAVVYGFGGYVVLCFVRAVLAAVEGLRVRNYRSPQAVPPAPGASREGSRFEVAKEIHACNTENREITNRKVSQWKLCTVALRNAGYALLFGVGFLLIVALWRAWAG